ncbi:MAG: D-2-hydroxyacid dehydrogenase [Acholeplasmataceae bacterium]
MKIFLETTYMNKNSYQVIIDTYKEHTFTFVEESDCEAIVGVFHGKDLSYFDQFKNLKWFLLITAGFDHIDLDYFKKRNITVTNGQGVYDIQIAEDVIAKMLFFNRRMDQYHDQMKSHLWKHQAPHYELYQNQVLILGAGSIGQLIAKRLKSFEMDIIGYKRTFESLPNFDHIITSNDDLETYLKTCDYLIVSLPLNQHTKHFVSDHRLSLLKPTCLIVNIARGEIIDQDALIKYLKAKKIRGAALDVVTPEPLPKDHELWDIDQVFLSPHNASASPMMHQRRLDLVFDLLQMYREEKPLKHVVIRGKL